MGEAWYWQGEFDRARGSLSRALEVAGSDPWTRCHANRFLGDIVLNIDGRPDDAEPLFQEALAAAAELDDPFAIARTLLMAGWSPYWRLHRVRRSWAGRFVYLNYESPPAPLLQRILVSFVAAR